jgi:hypothetical protein
MAAGMPPPLVHRSDLRKRRRPFETGIEAGRVVLDFAAAYPQLRFMFTKRLAILLNRVCPIAGY